MAVCSIFPLPKIPELYASDSIPSMNNDLREMNESCILVGSNSSCKTSLLFQAALTYASKGEQVIFLCSQPFQRKPLQVDGMTPPSSSVCQHIKMVYISDAHELIKYISHFHMMGSLPVAILVDDLDFYVRHLAQEGDIEQNLARLCALLQDSVGFLEEKRRQPCHMLAAMTLSKQNKSLILLCHRFFREVWCTTADNSSGQNASININERRFFMYNTKTAVHIYYYKTLHSVFLDRVTQVSSTDCAQGHENITKNEEIANVNTV